MKLLCIKKQTNISTEAHIKTKKLSLL